MFIKHLLDECVIYALQFTKDKENSISNTVVQMPCVRMMANT
jgi:hypothetical protein